MTLKLPIEGDLLDCIVHLTPLMFFISDKFDQKVGNNLRTGWDRARFNGVKLVDDIDVKYPGRIPFALQIFDRVQNHPDVQYVKELLGEGTICTNAMCYAPQTTMGWHTNSNDAGVRYYFVYSEKPGNVFRYVNPVTKEVIDEVETEGWSVRAFSINAHKDGLLWHTIWAEHKRISFGFNVGVGKNRK